MKKVLIVEDELIIAMINQQIITKLGCNVTEIVTSGQAAIESVKNIKPDIILMDILIEGNIDGIETVKKIQKQYNDIKVIYLTGNSESRTKKRAKETNFVDFLVKPIEEIDLKNALDKI